MEFRAILEKIKPNQNMTPHYWLGLITEELGELAKEVRILEVSGETPGWRSRLDKEASDVFISLILLYKHYFPRDFGYYLENQILERAETKYHR